MGNSCLRLDSNDTCPLQQPRDHNININACNPEKQRLLGDRQIRAANSSSSRVGPTATASGDHQQVKIKIRKKELEELVGSRGDFCMEGLSSSSVEQLLARLIIISSTNNNIHVDPHHHDHYDQMEGQRSWRPALQSISELN